MITTNDIGGVNRKRHDKWGMIEITYEALAKLLGLPDNYTIVSVSDPARRHTINSIHIKMMCNDTKSIGEGEEMASMLPGNGSWDRIG